MKKRISGILLAGVIMLSSSLSIVQANVEGDETVKALNFTDISKHWSNEAVQGLLKMNAIPFSSDKFAPSKAITKSEFALMLRNAMGIKINYLVAPDIKDYFEDVSQDAPYAMALVDLVTLGVLEGKGSFKPDATITREEMIHYVMLAYKKLMADHYAMIKINPASFADVDAIKPEYSGEVARAQHDKLISGTGGNMFGPKQSATRSQAAVVIYKMIKLAAGQNLPVTIIPGATVKEASIEMKISIVNNTKQAVIFNHSSGQKYDFALYDSQGNDLYRWSADKSFTMALTSTKIEAGKTLEFSESLSGDQFDAIKDKIAYLKAFIIGSSDSFDINEDGYEYDLKTGK